MTRGDARMPRLTASQRSVVLAGETHLLVGAGAGSGKTSTVVQTICYLLGAPVVDEDGVEHRTSSALQLSEIAAVTFTNQAAADLKRKLRHALKASSLGRIAADVDTARIGTIHAFCGDLLREFALRAGLAPSTAVLAEGDARTLAFECAERTLLDVVSSRAPDALEPLLAGRRLRDVVAAIVALADDTGRLQTYGEARERLRDHERLLLDLAERSAAMRQSLLRQEGRYDFDRMIVATRDMLHDHPDVRHAAQRRIRVLIVDEFQDVDPVQRDIAMLFGGLDTMDPAPSRILLVGDPKQSIFRFRRADVTLWNEVAQRFTAEGSTERTAGRVVALSENFRSRKGILAFVDHVFGTALDTPVDGSGVRQRFEVDYMGLDARSDAAAGDECVELLCIPPSEGPKPYTAAESRRFEATEVARRIRELRAAGRGYGDMAMLLAGWSDVALYESALRAAGIPVYVLRGEGFWEAREVVDCLLALRAIRDGANRAGLPAVADLPALVGFLKSPFVGLRDETLLALSQHPGGWREAMRQESRERALLDRACALLERFQALRDRLPLGELLQRLVSESGFLATLSLDPLRAAQAAGNIRKLVRLATEARDLSLGEWLRDIQEGRDREDLVAQERLYRERADVVTITSIHSAKGLEWPIVFWCDLIREQHRATDALIAGRTLFRFKDVRLLDKDGDIDDPEFKALQAEQGLEQLAEAYRLWYVAATRPKELLILSGIPLRGSSRDAISVARRIREIFAAPLAETPVPSTITYPHRDGTTYSLVVRLAAIEPAIEQEVEPTPAAAPQTSVPLTPPPPRRSVSTGRMRLSATQLSRFSESPDAWWRTYTLGFDPERIADASSARGTPGVGARQGSVVHDVLEHYNFELTDIDELIGNALVRHDADDNSGGLPEDFQARIRALIDAALQNDRWRALVNAPHARRELRFTRILADGATIEGAFDLAVVSGDATQIVDLKTGGHGAAEQIAQRYAVQGATYVEAAQAITGGRAAHFELLRLADGATIPVAADPPIVQRLVVQLREQAFDTGEG